MNEKTHVNGKSLAVHDKEPKQKLIYVYAARQRGHYIVCGATSAETVEFNGLRRCKKVKLLWSFGGPDSLPPANAIVWRRYKDVENRDRRLIGCDESVC